MKTGIIAMLALIVFASIAVAQPSNFDGGGLYTPVIEKYVFIHYKKDFAKDTNAPAAKDVSCFKLMGVKWASLPVNYVINPSNPQNLLESFITSAIYSSAEEWDAHTSKELFGTYTVEQSAVAGVQNYKNEMSWGDYPQQGVIAVTYTWATKVKKQIVEFDVLFDTDWAWGDGATASVMDLQNIATHEIGHGIGLSDLYSSRCGEVTMYGYSDFGETKKRTLEPADIAGLQKIYSA